MTDAQKRKFLRAEKWQDWTTPGSDACYWDPVKNEYERSLIRAYRIAKRRKDARDRARLKKAGLTYGECISYGFGWFDAKDKWIGAKAEALATLDGKP